MLPVKAYVTLAWIMVASAACAAAAAVLHRAAGSEWFGWALLAACDLAGAAFAVRCARLARAREDDE